MIKPLGKRVLLKRIEVELVSAGGIVLPDSAQEKPKEAIVIALGNGGKNEDGTDFAFSVAVNDKVLLGQYGSTEVKVDGEEYIIMPEADILGIVG